MMLYSFVITTLAIVGQSISADEPPHETPPGDTILGRWFTEDQRAQIEIYREDDEDGEPRYFGKIVWLHDPYYRGEGPEYGAPLRDANNPDEDRRFDPIMGLVILRDFAFNPKKNRWQDGAIYDPENGKTYHGSLKHVTTDSGEERLRLRGYVLVRLLGRSTTWTRVPDDFVRPEPRP